ncbi:MAG TPA: thioredoxin [Rhizomicrobium sp.]|nr:thioredoxin [Rhizomicrobium sp.]
MALIDTSGRPIAPKPADGAAPAPTSNSPYVKDSSLATFAADVLEASREVPVIVDFWAPWCGPCKQLGPALERAVDAAKGAVRMVKINVDENQEIARQLRIQSIPTVYAFKNGQPVDGFMGAIPESQIRAFVDNLTGGHGGHDHAAEVLAAADEALAAGDIAMAAQAYGHVLQDEPGHPKAVAGLARCYLKSGDLERARATLQLVRPDGAGDEALRAVEAELQLAEGAQKQTGGDHGALLAKLEADPKDHQARYDLALALDASGDRQGALDQLLELVRRDRKWNDDAARKHLVTLFEAMGPADERTIAARRKLSSILFS